MPISDLTKFQLEQYSKESSNWKELMIKCGYTNLGCRTYLKRKLEICDIDISHFINTRNHKKYTNEEIFKENSEYSTMNGIKNKLINQFGWKYECSNCKLSEWMNHKIPIEIDHINGNHTDNRIENLRFLCPNCHALTDTYKGKNIKNKEHSKEKYDLNQKNKICVKCNNQKHKNSEYCRQCHIKIKLHKITDTTNNTKKCLDCDKYISKKSLRCKMCHYTLMKSKSSINDKDHIKGKCIDCSTNIESRAIRCVICSNKIIENANKNISNTCIDCSKNIGNLAKRCTDCYIINSRKVIRPSYEQLLEDKSILNMVQIGKKYNVSDNTIRKWLKRYNMIESK